ncbi:MAG: 1-phosphofructokinase family hexose kinase [Erysipelotrichaceae bacterium]|nr:1-phosphofructokinase family hexose kinase [Erysipelotrichaceae bacterium]
MGLSKVKDMIHTITLNPSIDYYLHPASFEIGVINRASEVDYIAAGKGINVSRMLSELSIPSTCIFPAGGFTGSFLVESLKKVPLVSVEQVMIEGISRINVKIRHQQETDLNAEGPKLSRDTQERLLDLMKAVKEGDYVVISGSIQHGLNELITRIAERVNAQNGRLVLDVPNLPLEDLVACRPYLIKPNMEELQSFLNSDRPLEQLLPEARSQLIDRGVSSILISLGKDGACYLSKDEHYTITGPVMKPLNTVAAGDSMLSAAIGHLSQGSDIKTALKYGVACGSAAVMAPYLPTRDQVEAIYKLVSIS